MKSNSIRTENHRKSLDTASPGRLKALITGQAKILKMISKGASLSAILEAIVKWVEDQSNEELLASILIADVDGKHLLYGAAPSLPDEYNQAIHGISIEDSSGSCGTAAYTKEPVIVENTTTDPLWKDFRKLALKFNLMACWSTPLLTKEGKVLGTFAMYYKHPKNPDAHDLQIIELVSNTAIIAIEHARAAVERNQLLSTISKDLRQEKTFKKTLKGSEQRFRVLVNQAAVAIGVLKGKNMIIETANDAILELWGKGTAVIGLPFLMALPEVKNQPFPALLQQVFESGVPHYGSEFPARLVRNGKREECYFNFIYAPFREECRITGVQIIGNEVSELVHAREQLAEAEERLRMAVEAAEMGTWSINLLTGEVHFSERARGWYGFTGKTIDMNAGFPAIHEEDRERALDKLQQTLQSGAGDLYEDEYRVVNLQDGSQRIVRPVGKVLFNDKKEPVLITGVVYDITRQKMNKELLERQVQMRTKELQVANRHLQQYNEELEQFTFVTSHDLQEPLRKIRIFSGMLEDRLVSNSDPLVQQYLQKISASAERMTCLIRDLLNYYQVGSKKELFTRVDLNETVKTVTQGFELLIRQKEAVIRTDTLPAIEAIPLQMHELFYNLIGNTLKFTSDEIPPRISITSRLLPEEEVSRHPALHRGEKYYLITIADNGIGFDPSLKNKLFTVFQRLHADKKYEGTGIGLALCKKIVLANGGLIWADGEKEKGADFNIILPLNQ